MLSTKTSKSKVAMKLSSTRIKMYIDAERRAPKRIGVMPKTAKMHQRKICMGLLLSRMACEIEGRIQQITQAHLYPITTHQCTEHKDGDTICDQDEIQEDEDEGQIVPVTYSIVDVRDTFQVSDCKRNTNDWKCK
jgi:hypothetical protein